MGIPTTVSLITGAFVIAIGLLGLQTVQKSAHMRHANHYASIIEDEGGTIIRRERTGPSAKAGRTDPKLAESLAYIEQAAKSLETELAELELAQNEFASVRQRIQFLRASADKVGVVDQNLAFKALDLQEKARDVRRTVDDRNSQLVASNVERIQRAIMIGAVLMLFALVAFMTARRATRRELVDPIVAARDGLNNLTQGVQDFTVIGTERDDEIGEMARALEGLKSYSKQFVELHQATAEQAQAQESRRNQHAELLRQLAERFEATVGGVVGGVASASNQLQLTASSMASVAEQSSNQAHEVSGNLSQASIGVTAAAAACDEFALAIGEVSRQAANSAEIARKATKAASNADEAISSLTLSAGQIGEVVELISSIAQRTNLLALNASIEAARGGEAGRGFAVVAGEVKELAMQTARATQSVADQIRAMQDSTTVSTGALREIIAQIQQLEHTSISIASAVDQQAVASQDLARSIDLAARNAAEVSNNIVQVRETALATGSAASQVLSSSKDLQGQADVLRVQVDEFLSHVKAA